MRERTLRRGFTRDDLRVVVPMLLAGAFAWFEVATSNGDAAVAGLVTRTLSLGVTVGVMLVLLPSLRPPRSEVVARVPWSEQAPEVYRLGASFALSLAAVVTVAPIVPDRSALIFVAFYAEIIANIATRPFLGPVRPMMTTPLAVRTAKLLVLMMILTQITASPPVSAGREGAVTAIGIALAVPAFMAGLRILWAALPREAGTAETDAAEAPPGVDEAPPGRAVRPAVAEVTVTWTDDRGSGTSSYAAYGRDHEIASPDHASIFGSADPAFRGTPGRWTPEETFVASISACHQLWYLHLCAEAGILVRGYVDHASGRLRIDPDGGGRMAAVTLRPEVTIASGSRERALALHDAAHAKCFVANSVSVPIVVEAIIVDPGGKG